MQASRNRLWTWVSATAALSVAATFLAAPAPRAFAGDDEKADAKKEKKEEAKPQGLLVDLGNAKCPVMGDKTNGKTFSEWNGLRVGHCCGMCRAKFAAHPEELLDATGVDWKAAVAAVKKVEEATGADREKALVELKSKWTVVREPAPAPKGALVDLANAKCPVRGGAVDGKTFSEWNGLRIGHCCPGCGEKFLADPEKLLAAAKIEWKAAADAVKALDAAKGEERAKLLADMKKKWTLVREPAPEPTPPPASAK